MRDESWRSVKVIWLDREGAKRFVEEAAQRLLSERPEVLRAVLFGSLERGDAVPGSDADVLIVAETELRQLDRYPEYAPYFEGAPLDVELLVYTPAEVERMSKRPCIVRTALAEGRTIAERKAEDD